jgi:tetratricopeptide (TPR) repeat protein
VFPESFAKLSPGEQAFYRARAQALLARDAPARVRETMWNAAERDYLEAIRLGYDNVNSWFFLGKVRQHLGRRQAAHEAFKSAFGHDSAHHDAAFAWGQALVERNELQQALAIFDDLLRRDPANAMALAEAGRVLSLTGRSEETLSYFERAISAEPWNPLLRGNACRTLAALGRFDEAADMAVEAVRLNPDNPEMWELYEKAHEAAGRTAAALEGRRQREIMSRIPKSATLAAEM